MPELLLHLVTTDEWRAVVAAGVIAPPSLADVGFVHLSTPEQVHLPAQRLFAGRADVWLLVLDPDRIDVEVRSEPGVPGDPDAMRFPHAYGPVPLPAVTSVLPYRPGAAGFAPPAVPLQDPAGRQAVFEPSLVRRAATAEEPVTGGVGVLTEPFPASHQHNQLLIDGEVDAAQLVADADRVLGGAGLPHRKAFLNGAHLAPVAAELGERGWAVQEVVGMAAPVRAPAADRPWAEQVTRLRLAATWGAGWRRDIPGISPDHVHQLVHRFEVEEPVTDLRYLAVYDDRRPVASSMLKIDGATALVDAVATVPDHRNRGHGDTLLATSHALAAAAGCDLLVLYAATEDWPRQWYARRGFAEVGRAWEAVLRP